MEHVPFVHLHVKSEFSLLGASCRISTLVQRAHALKMPALALTDNGNLFGAVQFYRQCRAVGLKPVLGCELNVAIGSRTEKTRGARRYHQLVVLAENEIGWRNLMQLASDAYLEGFYYKPRTDKAQLREHSAGLIALSGGLPGEIPSALRDGHVDEAEQAARELRDIFGAENVFLELQDHGIRTEQLVNEGLVELSARLDIPLVATNEVYYVDRADAAAHDVLITLGQNTTLDDPRRWRLEGEEWYLRSYEEMRELFAAHPEALEHARTIADRCTVELKLGALHLPTFQVPGGATPETHLSALCEHGLQWRYETTDVAPEVRERLAHELDIIGRMGYAGYFLIVHDFIREAGTRGIPVGPGRGSAAGSLVSYLLGITGLDPLRFGLIFERFLNPDRINMPDIDIDFCYERRGEIIEYVTQKYGAECVCQIITFGQMRARAVIRDVGRVLGMEFGRVDALAKLVPNELNITLTEAIERETELQRLRDDDPDVAQLLVYALQLEGLARHASTHAAGVVISDAPLTNHVPLFKHASSGDITTQFPMGDLEELGLLKMDFLGLRTLTVMQHAVESIHERLGETIDLATIPLDDSRTFEMLSRGECMGVFQMESTGMRELARRVGLSVFDDVVALVALFRPGPMKMLPDYVSRKHGHTQVVFDHESMKPILGETHGIMLYQEQVMQIAVDMAGFTMAEADTLRKAMGKKLPAVMAQQEEKFVVGATGKGCAEGTARKVWNDIQQFAGYGFNKSHSAAYGLIAYQTAWLKSHYPIDFMAALLTSEMSTTDKIVQYITEAERLGIEVDAPDIKASVARFRVVDGGTIRFGLAAVKNVGEGAIAAIVAEREAAGPFASLYDFCRRVDLRQVNRRVIESLIRAGAMDIFGRPRHELFEAVSRAMEVGQVAQRDRQAGQTSLLDMLSGDDADAQVAAEESYATALPAWSEHELLQGEKEVLGLYVTGHPLANNADTLRRYCAADAATLRERHPGEIVTVGGMIRTVKTIINRKGDKMAFVELEDLVGVIEATVFADAFAKYAAVLVPDQLVLLTGRVDQRDDENKLIAECVTRIEDAEAQLTTEVHVRFNTRGLEKGAVDQLHEAMGEFRDAQSECRLVLHLETPDAVVEIQTPHKLDVARAPQLRDCIGQLLGTDSIWFTGHTRPRQAVPKRRAPVRAGSR